MTESADPAGDARRLAALAAAMAEVERLEGVDPAAVEEKAALEARRAAEAVVVAGAPVPWAAAESRWTRGKMETPGVQQWEYTYVLRLDVAPAHAEEVFTQVWAYWTGRGLAIDHWDPAVGVSADPGRGAWVLAAGVLDETALFVRVESGVVMTSSDPLADGPGNEKES